MKRKFVNKKTGAEARVMAIYLDSDGVMQVDSYDAVEDLMDDYAAYEEYNPPKEPRIKDAECREIMRLWADRCGIKSVMLFGSEFRYGAKSICFGTDFGLDHLERYTIDELCGEDKE